jgi:hypothetical protein
MLVEVGATVVLITGVGKAVLDELWMLPELQPAASRLPVKKRSRNFFIKLFFPAACLMVRQV